MSRLLWICVLDSRTGARSGRGVIGNWYRLPYQEDRSPLLIGLGVRLGTVPRLEEAEGNSTTKVDIKKTYLWASLLSYLSLSSFTLDRCLDSKVSYIQCRLDVLTSRRGYAQMKVSIYGQK